MLDALWAQQRSEGKHAQKELRELGTFFFCFSKNFVLFDRRFES